MNSFTITNELENIPPTMDAFLLLIHREVFEDKIKAIYKAISLETKHGEKKWFDMKSGMTSPVPSLAFI